MRLKKLIKQADKKEVLRLLSPYCENKGMRKAYKRLLKRLRALEPSLCADEECFTVSVTPVPTVNKKGKTESMYYDVDGASAQDDSVRFSLVFSSHADWLSYRVDKESLRAVGREMFVCQVLREMSLYGFSDAEVEAEAQLLVEKMEQSQEADGLEGFVSLEDLIGEFAQEQGLSVAELRAQWDAEADEDDEDDVTLRLVAMPEGMAPQAQPDAEDSGDAPECADAPDLPDSAPDEAVTEQADCTQTEDNEGHAPMELRRRGRFEPRQAPRGRRGRPH